MQDTGCLGYDILKEKVKGYSSEDVYRTCKTGSSSGCNISCEMMESYSTTTEIVVNQPKTVTLPSERMHPRGIPRDWSSGLFDICDDFGICLFECLLPPCHACSLSKDMDEGLCMPLCVPFAPVLMRTYVRGKHNIQGSVLKDYCTALWCGPCMNCQLHREVNKIKSGEALP